MDLRTQIFVVIPTFNLKFMYVCIHFHYLKQFEEWDIGFSPAIKVEKDFRL